MTRFPNPRKFDLKKKSGKIKAPKKIRHMILETPDCDKWWVGTVEDAFRFAENCS